MKRREFLAGMATLGAWATTPGGPLINALTSGSGAPRLTPPEKGAIPVAVALTEGATVIDFAGPWEVFQDVDLPGDAGFQLFTVGDSTKPIRGSAGLQLVPDYAFENAPQPR